MTIKIIKMKGKAELNFHAFLLSSASVSGADVQHDVGRLAVLG